MASPPSIKAYTAAELAASPSVLNDTLNVINIAFIERERESKGFEGPRFPTTDDFLDTLGPTGLCAVASSLDSILAAASLVPWQPTAYGAVSQALRDTRPDDFALLGKGVSYEVKAVATALSPEARGKGLPASCISKLADVVFARQHPEETTLLLWVLVAEDTMGAYWRRNGYEQVGPTEVMPKGMWESTRDFRFSTLVKRVHKSGEDGRT
jgi:GNAT superfamily N-acetyltransferase